MNLMLFQPIKAVVEPFISSLRARPAPSGLNQCPICLRILTVQRIPGLLRPPTLQYGAWSYDYISPCCAGTIGLCDVDIAAIVSQVASHDGLYQPSASEADRCGELQA